MDPSNLSDLLDRLARSDQWDQWDLWDLSFLSRPSDQSYQLDPSHRRCSQGLSDLSAPLVPLNLWFR